MHKSNLRSGSIYEVNDKAYRVLTDKTIEALIMNGAITVGSSANPRKNPFLDAQKKSLKQDLVVCGTSEGVFVPPPAEVSFDSEFESGNLDLAFRVSESEYNLLTRCDTNSKGHNQWFFFKVKSHSSSSLSLKLNIINLVKPKSLFGRGAFPYVGFRDGHGRLFWDQLSESCRLAYARTPPKFELNESNKKKTYMTLSFTLELEPGAERYLAYSIPYTYSDLLRYLDGITNHGLQHTAAKPESHTDTAFTSKKAARLHLRKYESPFLRVTSLCKGESMIDVPLLEITDFSEEPNEMVPYKLRPIVYVVSRVHPSESVASYSVEGLINKLLDDSPASSALRKLLVFKVVPMMNPDGVLAGNFRTNLCGDDLNRRYDTPSSYFHPTVRPAHAGQPLQEAAARRPPRQVQVLRDDRHARTLLQEERLHLRPQDEQLEPKEHPGEVARLPPVHHDRHVPLPVLHLESSPVSPDIEGQEKNLPRSLP